MFSEREEAGAIISDNHKLDHTDVLSKNNSKIKLFISLLIIIIGSAIGWFIIFFKKREKRYRLELLMYSILAKEML
ncbi:hypothetical protein ICE98_03021 [Lactococcus lactis]|nr:hypothetical protein [Lactococcus lactis]